MPDVELDLPRLRVAFRRGDHDTVAALAPTLTADPDPGVAAEALLLLGAADAAAERFADAHAALTAGLDRHPPPVPPARPDDLAWFELLLLDVCLVLGWTAEVLGRVTPLLEPNRDLETRFGATRAQAAAGLARGDGETAHALLNTAAGLAGQLRSRLRVALVEGDRAIVLAQQGRMYEAVATGDRVVADLLRSGVGTYGAWARNEGLAVSFALSRGAAEAGDLFTAQRLLLAATQPAADTGSSLVEAQWLLADGTLARAEGDLDRAEERLPAAAGLAAAIGCEPLAAQVLLEQARLARARGLAYSARPLAERALHEFTRLGRPIEVAAARRVLAG